MQIDISGWESQSFPIKAFQSPDTVLQRQSWNTRGSLQRLSQKFKTTQIGRRVYKALRKNQPNQIVAEVVFKRPPTLEYLHRNKILSSKKPVNTHGDKTVSSLVLYIDNGKEEIKLKALTDGSKFLSDVFPHNPKCRPNKISFDIYGIYLINLFRDLAMEFDLLESRPGVFAKLSSKRAVRLDL